MYLPKKENMFGTAYPRNRNVGDSEKTSAFAGLVRGDGVDKCCEAPALKSYCAIASVGQESDGRFFSGRRDKIPAEVRNKFQDNHGEENRSTPPKISISRFGTQCFCTREERISSSILTGDRLQIDRKTTNNNKHFYVAET